MKKYSVKPIGQTATLVLVTPALAEKWLAENNVDNRRLRGVWVATIARIIQRGEYQTSSQGIAFDTDGILIDGQHRLSAIVASGTALWMWVFRGMPVETKKVLDVGVKRSAGDVTGMHEDVAQVVRYLGSLLYPNADLTATVLLKVADTGMELIANDLREHCSTTAKAVTAAPARAAVVYAVASGLVSQEFAFSQYAALVHKDFDAMTPRVKAYFRRVDELPNATKLRQFTFMLAALDPNRTDDVTTLKVTEPMHNEYIADARESLSLAISLVGDE